MDDKVSIASKLSQFSDHWNPRIVGELNGQHVKLVKFQGEFVWHHHDAEDELFLVVEGRFRMEFRDRAGVARAGRVPHRAARRGASSCRRRRSVGAAVRAGGNGEHRQRHRRSHARHARTNLIDSLLARCVWAYDNVTAWEPGATTSPTIAAGTPRAPAPRGSPRRAQRPPTPASRRTSAGRSRRRARPAPPRRAGRRPRSALGWCPSQPDRFCDAIAVTPGSSGSRATSIAIDTPLALAISVAWPIRPKPVMSVAPWTAPANRSQDVGGRLVQHRHRRDGERDELPPARPFLDRGPDDAGAEPLGEDQPIAGARAGVGPDAIGIDRAGHGIAELHLGIAYRVAAEQRDAGFAQLVVAAQEDLLDGVGVEDLVGKPRDRQRRHGRPAHRVDVAERVGGGDLAVSERVVDDRREEVHRLHERRAAARPPVHTGIVGGPEVDQHPGIGLRW